MSFSKYIDNKPKIANLKKNQAYSWCACGLCKNQPFADDNCKDSLEFKVEEDGPKALCMCKLTKNPPYCDGSHTNMDMDKCVNKSTSENVVESSDQIEPTIERIKDLSNRGLPTKHGHVGAMGVPLNDLPKWDDIQIITAQLAAKPQNEDVPIKTKITIGPNAKKPLVLDMPIFIADMSFGALSREAKIAMAKGAEKVGTGIASGEGGMLPEEQSENSRYLYELASGLFGFDWEKMKKIQAFHFKGGQGAKTGTGGHLPGEKVTDEIAKVRNLKTGQDAISPSKFKDLNSAEDFKIFADEVRRVSGGIPIGFKLSANHIENDIEFAIQASADYIVIDGRGGGTGAAPLLFRDNISVPTIPAIARARKYLDRVGRKDITLIATGGLRVADDFIKALCMGADGVAIASSAMQSIGCDAARICHTNQCPKGIATQNSDLTSQLNIEKSSKQLASFLKASNELIAVMARACGHEDINHFNQGDITTWKKEIADLTGIHFAGDSISVDEEIFKTHKNIFSLEKFNAELNDKIEDSSTTKKNSKITPSKYKCLACGHIYDPSEGDPENGIAIGTTFESLPDDWICPSCGVGKDMFEKI